MKKITLFISGIIIGILNMLLGAGGGMLAVPVLKKCDLKQKEAQATALTVTLPLSFVSLIIYLFNGNVKLNGNIFLPLFGASGAFLGAFLLKKVSNKWLKRIFACFLLFAGARILIKG